MQKQNLSSIYYSYIIQGAVVPEIKVRAVSSSIAPASTLTMADVKTSKEPEASVARDYALGDVNDVKVDGNLEFVQEYGGNGSLPSYQEASGAPVESVSPLGLQVTWFTTIFLNIGQMIGTGVFSTRMFPLSCFTSS